MSSRAQMCQCGSSYPKVSSVVRKAASRPREAKPGEKPFMVGIVGESFLLCFIDCLENFLIEILDCESGQILTAFHEVPGRKPGGRPQQHGSRSHIDTFEPEITLVFSTPDLSSKDATALNCKQHQLVPPWLSI